MPDRIRLDGRVAVVTPVSLDHAEYLGPDVATIAAEKAGRVARLIELDPKYADVIVRRWQDWTGQQATREADGLTFDQAASDSSVISQ